MGMPAPLWLRYLYMHAHTVYTHNATWHIPNTTYTPSRLRNAQLSCTQSKCFDNAEQRMHVS